MFRVRVPGDEREQQVAASVLQQAGFGVQTDADGHLVVDVEQAESPRVTKTLADAAIYVAELTPIERTLEDAFFELTQTGSEPGT
jgi:ABC-2 type transport system ATP-binding protein